MEFQFILLSLVENKHLFPAFYLLLKIHKTLWKTHPIVSCTGSLLHLLGVWLEHYMQDITKSMPTYFANSKDLKYDLIKLNIPPGAKLFTADAMLMCTNLPTKQAIVSIGKYLMENRDEFCHLPITAICDALWIIMTMNAFTFGNSYWLQET
eukprot:15336415-Ditylum_brightwellii.AAC.1